MDIIMLYYCYSCGIIITVTRLSINSDHIVVSQYHIIGQKPRTNDYWRSTVVGIVDL